MAGAVANEKESVSNVVHNFLATGLRVPRLHRDCRRGAQGSSDCRGRNNLAVPATKIAALTDSEGSGSLKACEEKEAANQRLSESTQLISEAERPVIS